MPKTDNSIEKGHKFRAGGSFGSWNLCLNQTFSLKKGIDFAQEDPAEA